MLVGQFAKSIGMKRTDVYEYLHSKGILLTEGAFRNAPAKEYADAGYFTYAPEVIDVAGQPQAVNVTRITETGQEWLKRIMHQHGAITTLDMSETAIVETDKLLRLVDAFRTTPQEIAWLNKAGHSPVDIEGYYGAALAVLEWRTDTHQSAGKQIDDLVEMAAMDGVTLSPKPAEIPQVDIPIFGIGL